MYAENVYMQRKTMTGRFGQPEITEIDGK